MNANFQGKRVLVTGGTGFIGSFLVEELLRRGAQVRVPMRSKNFRALSTRRSEIEWMDGDLREATFCRKLISGCDFIFHLASHRRNVRYHHERCREVFEANVATSRALIAALEGAPHVPVVFFSTGNIPEHCDVAALSSQKVFDGYVVSKAACEELWEKAHAERGFPLLIIRPVGIYGPRDTFSLEGNVVPALMVKAQRSKEVLHVWGSGRQVRSFLYVEDVARAVFMLIEAGAEGVQPLLSSESVDVASLAEKIRDLVNPALGITFDALQPEGMRSLPRLPLHPVIGGFRWMPLEEGLRRTWEWWNASKKKPRKRSKELQRAG